MADPLEVGNHGGEPGPDEAAALDPDGQRRLELLPAARTPPGMTAMLLDLQRHVPDVDLLDHSGHDRRHGLQMIPATGTKIEAIVDRRTVDRSGREGGAVVLGVARLAPDAAPLLTLRRVRLGRLDDVGGRWLRGGRGILAGRGQLRLETRDGSLERLQPRLLGIQQRLQAPAVRARLPWLGFHGWLCYIPDRSYAITVNGHARLQLLGRGPAGRPLDLRPLVQHLRLEHDGLA